MLGIRYQWRKGPESVIFRPHIYLPTFRLVGYSKRNASEIMFGAKYSTLHLDIFIARHISFYIARIYVPSILVVIIRLNLIIILTFTVIIYIILLVGYLSGWTETATPEWP